MTGLNSVVLFAHTLGFNICNYYIHDIDNNNPSAQDMPNVSCTCLLSIVFIYGIENDILSAPKYKINPLKYIACHEVKPNQTKPTKELQNNNKGCLYQLTLYHISAFF